MSKLPSKAKMTAEYHKAEEDAVQELAQAQSIAAKSKTRNDEIKKLLATAFYDAHRAEVLRTDIWAHFTEGPDNGHEDAVKWLNDHIFLPAHKLLVDCKIPYEPDWIYGKFSK